MNKFFIMTRGRTGSTAIVDVLNKTKSVHTTREQEIFLRHEFPQIRKNFPDLKNYPSTLPFELWKTQTPKWWSYLPYRRMDAWLINRYLQDAEKLAMQEGVGAFGFKVLSNHFDENPSLKGTLLACGYRVLYLKRNVPHQVISGMIAKQRGVYNTKKDFQDDTRYILDIDEFKKLVEWEAQSVARDLELLRSSGFNFIEVTYEEFMADREAFFVRVLAFLGVPPEVPQASSYSVMIKDLKHTVENYQAVAECAATMGMSIE
ncbi:MAG: sulfotransferase [Nitrosomonadales bacterium]|nr:sulfotransferase [Nitrosomonadales bacterium]